MHSDYPSVLKALLSPLHPKESQIRDELRLLRAKPFYDDLVKKGIVSDDSQALGIVHSWSVESGFDPGESETASGSAVGLMQFTAQNEFYQTAKAQAAAYRATGMATPAYVDLVSQWVSSRSKALRGALEFVEVSNWLPYLLDDAFLNHHGERYPRWVAPVAHISGGQSRKFITSNPAFMAEVDFGEGPIRIIDLAEALPPALSRYLDEKAIFFRGNKARPSVIASVCRPPRIVTLWAHLTGVDQKEERVAWVAATPGDDVLATKWLALMIGVISSKTIQNAYSCR